MAPNTPMISALIPSRGRPDSLRRAIASLRDNAAAPERVEVLVAHDPDDVATGIATACQDVRVLQTTERYGYGRLHEYFNRLAAWAGGDWLLLWNDDATMLTSGWDTVIGDLPESVIVADLWVDGHSPDLCTFPAVRRWAVEAVGAFSAHTPHCDTYWQDLGRALHAIVPVEVEVYHDRSDLTGGHNDQTRHEALTGYRSGEFYSPVVQQAIAADVERLRPPLAKIARAAA